MEDRKDIDHEIPSYLYQADFLKNLIKEALSKDYEPNPQEYLDHSPENRILRMMIEVQDHAFEAGKYLVRAGVKKMIGC